MILIIKHIDVEGPGTIGDFFQNTDWEVKTLELNNQNTSSFSKDEISGLPENLSTVEAIILLGGPMNVYEEKKHPFLKDEDKFLKQALKQKIPIMGICLGAQLLAKACGAKIRKATNKEIGWYKVQLNEEGKKDYLFSGVENDFDVFQWHEDTFEIPEGATLLATSQSCKNQAFRFKENAYGLQFHVEIIDSLIQEWINEYHRNPDVAVQLKGKQMLIDYYKQKETLRILSSKIYFNFSKLIDRAAIKL